VQPKATDAIKFIGIPIGPKKLVVKPSNTEITAAMASGANGPYIKPAITSITSFGSYPKLTGPGTSGILISEARMYPIALSTASTAIVFTSNLFFNSIFFFLRK
jgi:DNA-binding beta-propeller fold protein YncE